MANYVVDGSTNHWAKESQRKSKFEVHGRYLEISSGCIEFELPVRLKEKLFSCLLGSVAFSLGKKYKEMDLNLRFLSVCL